MVRVETEHILWPSGCLLEALGNLDVSVKLPDDFRWVERTYIRGCGFDIFVHRKSFMNVSSDLLVIRCSLKPAQG